MWNRVRIVLTFVAPFILLLVSASGPVAAGKPHAPTYTIIDLGTLGGLESRAFGINAKGQIVGTSTTAAGGNHAFLWEAGTGMQDLGTLGGLLSPAVYPYFYSVAWGINARGQIVGYSAAAPGPTPFPSEVHAVLWEPGSE